MSDYATQRATRYTCKAIRKERRPIPNNQQYSPQPKPVNERSSKKVLWSSQHMWLSLISFVGAILCFVIAYMDYQNFMNALSTGITGLSWSTGYLGDMFRMIFYGLLCWLASIGEGVLS